MKIYTRTGDTGETALLGGERVSKADPRIGACGALDELNAHLGLARTVGCDVQTSSRLEQIQSALFRMGAELATPAGRVPDDRIPRLSDEDIRQLEQWIDDAEAVLVPLEFFILPGGALNGAQLHVACAVSRRAERSIVALAQTQGVRPELLRFANRLSDLLFTLARVANHQARAVETPWKGARGSGA